MADPRVESGRPPAHPDRASRPSRQQRALRTSLLRANGLTWQQISTIWLSDHPDVNPRITYRWAHNLSHQDVADAWNALDPGQPAQTTARIYEYEQWPRGGRRPPAAGLDMLARIYQTTARDLLTDHEFAGYDRAARDHITRSDHRHLDHHHTTEHDSADPDLRDHPHEQPTPLQPPRRPDHNDAEQSTPDPSSRPSIQDRPQETFGIALQRIRTDRSLSQRDLAAIAHIDGTHISKLENGHRAAPPDLAHALDDALQADGQLIALAQAERTTRTTLSATLKRALTDHDLSLRQLAKLAHLDPGHLSKITNGLRPATPATIKALDDALHANGELVSLAETERASKRDRATEPPTSNPYAAAADIDTYSDDELSALELANRVAASDVSPLTLHQLEQVVDELSMAYARTPPAELQPRVRRHVSYVLHLMGARKTLDQHRRLLIVGGWLSLIGATLNIDLRQRSSAHAQLATARQMADHAAHPEILAWCMETRAWDELTSGDYRQALELAQHAQALAPKGSSVQIQATAQESRTWARMGRRPEALQALNRTTKLVSPLPAPDRPEHHYQYDPGKALAYTATTLSWVGDPAAASYARDVVKQMEVNESIARPRRAAAARLDLGLALLRTGQPDEACSVAITAITSGLLVPSNWWRATELLTGVEAAGMSEAAELRDAYHTYEPGNR